MSGNRRGQPLALGLIVSAAVAACGGQNGATRATGTARAASTNGTAAIATGTGTLGRTQAPATAPPASASAPPDPLSTCPAVRAESTLTVLIRTGGTPDDLAATATGMWVSDEVRGRITSYTLDGAIRLVIADPRGPEGLLPLPDGTLIAGEQLPDRVVILHPPNPTPAVLLQLRPLAGHDGVDGIGIDASGLNLLIPDSARGTLVRLPVTGSGQPTLLSSGLGRPVAAAVGADGDIYVAAEGRPGLWRIPPGGGAAVAVGSENDLDEVIRVGPLLYVSSLADGSVRAVDPVTGRGQRLVGGGAQPQGLGLLPDGRLAMADSGRGAVFGVPICGR